MMVRKCDRCGKEIKTNDIKYFLITQKSCPKKDSEFLGSYDLCESCYAELNNFIFKYERNNK